MKSFSIVYEKDWVEFLNASFLMVYHQTTLLIKRKVFIGQVSMAKAGMSSNSFVKFDK